MSVIVYRKYSFKEPAPITYEQYMALRQEIAANAKFEINSDFKLTFSSQYRKTVRWFFIGLVILFTGMSIYKGAFASANGTLGGPQLIVLLVIIAGGAIVLGMILRIFLEGPSMATFLTERKIYFGRLKHAIKAFSDYPTFYTTFYGDGKKGPNVPFRKEVLLEQKATPRSMDRSLTSAFCWLDRNGWKIGLVVIAIFLIRKYLL